MKPPPLDATAVWISREIKFPRQLFRARFSPDGHTIAAGGQDRLVHLWDLRGEEPLHRSLNGHETWLSSLAFHPTAPRLFTADYQGVIHCWNYLDENSSKPIWTIPSADRDNVRSLVVTPDGRHLISAGDDAIIKFWRTDNGKKLIRLEGHHDCIFSLAISPDGKHLVSGDLLGTIRQWDLADGSKFVRVLDASLLHTRGEQFLADVGGVRSLAFNAEGTLLAAGGMKDAKSNAFCPGKPTVLVFDWLNGKIRSELRIKGKSDGPLNSLCFLSNGTLAGHTEILHANSELVFWKIDQPDPLHSLVNPSAYELSLHPDGRQLLAACYLSGGSGGNGARKRDREKYISNGSTLRVFSLYRQPADT